MLIYFKLCLQPHLSHKLQRCMSNCLPNSSTWISDSQPNMSAIELSSSPELCSISTVANALFLLLKEKAFESCWVPLPHTSGVTFSKSCWLYLRNISRIQYPFFPTPTPLLPAPPIVSHNHLSPPSPRWPPNPKEVSQAPKKSPYMPKTLAYCWVGIIPAARGCCPVNPPQFSRLRRSAVFLS